jgi:hypothetical protein
MGSFGFFKGPKKKTKQNKTLSWHFGLISSHALLGLSFTPHLMLHPLLAVVLKVMK